MPAEEIGVLLHMVWSEIFKAHMGPSKLLSWMMASCMTLYRRHATTCRLIWPAWIPVSMVLLQASTACRQLIDTCLGSRLYSGVEMEALCHC